MKKIEIAGLLNLESLFLFDDLKKNFENAVNSAYKMSEDGAKYVVIWGSNFNARVKIYKYLKNKMDIPVTPFVLSELQYAKVLEEDIVFSGKNLPETIYTLRPKKNDFLKSKMSNSILITNKDILKIFKTTLDFTTEFSSMIAFRLCEINYKFFITEEVLSARKGAELCNKLF